MRRSIIADSSVLETYHCTTEKIPVTLTSTKASEAHNTDSHVEVLLHPSGWKFQSFHRHILNEKERRQLASKYRHQLRRLFPSFADPRYRIPEEDDDDIHWDNLKLHIPPMLFGRDIMQFEYKDLGRVNVSAEDALFCWLCQHVPEVVEEHQLNVIQVPYAKKWASRVATNMPSSSTVFSQLLSPSHGISSIQESNKHHQQQTGHLPSLAGVQSSTSTPSSTPTQLSSPSEHASSSSSSSSLASIRACDWTYSTDYCCSLEASKPTEEEIQPLEKQHSVVHGRTFNRSNIFPLHKDYRQEIPAVDIGPLPWTVTEESSSGIDYELLKRRDLPILFYDEMTLYEDDLEDCGEISVEAKVRVLPNCWFALVRSFLRIDHVVARCRETRLFHRFVTKTSEGASLAATEEEQEEDGDAENDVKIHVEVVWREKSLEEEAALFAAATASTTSNTVSCSSTPVPAVPAASTAAASTVAMMATSMPHSNAAIAATAAVPVTQQLSPAAAAVLRSAQGSVIPPALAAVMQQQQQLQAMRTAASTTASSSTTSLPTRMTRYTKENASEVLPQCNEAQHIPAYYTFHLKKRNCSAATGKEEKEREGEEEQAHSHDRQLHWFGLAAARGVRK